MSDTCPKANGRFYALAVIAYVFATFSVQATSHFAINVDHYAAIDFMRKDEIMELGILTMILEGAILAYFFPQFYRSGPPILQGLKFSLLMGLFLGGYIVLVEPAKYMVPSVSEWIVVEGLASLAQFSLFGVLLGVLYDKIGARA